MIHFDKHSLDRWTQGGVTVISCILIEGGCEGTEVSIVEGKEIGDLLIPVSESTIRCMVSRKDQSIFDDAYLTYTKNKWILSSKNVLTHCGCGKSFKAKTGNEKIDRFLLMKSAYEKKHHIHT